MPCSRQAVGDVAEQVQRLGGRAARGEQDGRQQPAGLGARGRDVVRVHGDGVAAEVGGRQRDRVAVRDEDLVAGDVERGDVLAEGGADEHRRVGGAEVARGSRPADRPGACPGPGASPVARSPSSSSSESMTKSQAPSGQSAPDGSASTSGELARPPAAPASRLVRKAVTAPAARPASASRMKSPTTSTRAGSTPMRRRRAEHAVGRGLGRVGVVARDDDVEVGGVEVVEVAEGAVDGRAAVARDDAELEAVPAEPAHGLLRPGVGPRPGRPFELEALAAPRTPRRAARPPAAPR